MPNLAERAAGSSLSWRLFLALAVVLLCACEKRDAEPSEQEESAPGSEEAAGAEPEGSESSAADPEADEPAAEATEEPRPEESLGLGNLDTEGEVEPTLEELTFSFALSHEPVTFDPALVTDANSAQIVFNTFEGLMSFDAGSGPVVPAVAERYEIGDEGRRITFELRDDVRWSNGDPVTAYDFEYAWKRVLDPDTESKYAWIMTEAARIVGARDYNAGRGSADKVGVSALDTRTLEVRLEAPVANFVEMTALFTFAPVHRRTIDTHGDEWTRADNWVSNGPYILVAHREDREFVLRKNPEYWAADDVEMERITVRVIEEDTGRMSAFDAGLIDWTGPSNLPVAATEKRRDELGFQLHQDPYLAVEYLVFNTQREPLDDKRVREAIALAIDREELVVKVLGGVGRPARGFVPPLPGFRSQVERTSNPARARKQLAAAGHPGGEGLRALQYAYPRGNSNAAAMARIVRTQLEAVGIEVELKEMPYADMLSAASRHEFDIARMGWVADWISPATFLTLWTSGSQQNYAGWKSRPYDALLDQASRTTDRGARYALYEEAEQMLDRELPVTPLIYYEQIYVLREDFGGFEPHVLNVHLLKYVTRNTD